MIRVEPAMSSVGRSRLAHGVQFLLVAVSLLPACEDGYRNHASDESQDSDSETETGIEVADGGDLDSDADTGGSDCNELEKLVYVIDDGGALYSFDPQAPAEDAFNLIATLSCPSGGEPFSMGVSREGFAYVLFWTGSPMGMCIGMNKIEIETGECLGLTSFDCFTGGFGMFGMGYVTDGPDTNAETLYIGNADSPAIFGTLEPESGEIAELGYMYSEGPEFTGNSLGELWGFFPEANPPRVMNIDKESGFPLEQYEITEILGGLGPAAWAFAHWGGDFYIFYKDLNEDSTSVYRLADGEVTVHLASIGMTVVGAGVSTCAPVVIE
jgi:hypothetical protein